MPVVMEPRRLFVCQVASDKPSGQIQPQDPRVGGDSRAKRRVIGVLLTACQKTPADAHDAGRPGQGRGLWLP